MRIAITGAGGRLGRALVAALEGAAIAEPDGPIAWRRPEYDLDSHGDAARLVARDRPDVVIHAAAWTDVDGCARDPHLAMRRNGAAAGEMASVAADRGIDLVLISTNEVFDGRRVDGRGYAASDEPKPINPYGASKLAGELAARAAFAHGGAIGGRGMPTTRPARLSIIRTSWLYGPPGDDFPAKILDAADRARSGGSALRVVADEVGSPTSATDLAAAIAGLLSDGLAGGVDHLVNGGSASRAAWAREVLRLAGRDDTIEEVSSDAWQRASTPPRWAVLEPTHPAGLHLRAWQEALAEYVPRLLASRSATPA